MASPLVLSQIQLFSGLGAAAQRALSAVASERAYEDGQLIMLEGDGDAPAFFVLCGTVRVYRTSMEGREQNLIHLHAGDGFNMPAAFVPHGMAPASAVAIGAVELLAIAGPDFCRVVSETPEIALAVLGDLAQKLHHLTNLSHDLGLRSVRGRLARFLLAHTQGQDQPPLRWTHQEIAAQIGTVREVVSRTLRAFVKDGLIEVQRHRVVVRDVDALAREAQS
jgi:CRP/FNR family transcriptional regulator, cyclic AMP receptor protein